MLNKMKKNVMKLILKDARVQSPVPEMGWGFLFAGVPTSKERPVIPPSSGGIPQLNATVPSVKKIARHFAIGGLGSHSVH